MLSLRWGIMAPGGIAATFAQDLKSTNRTLIAVGSRSRHRAEQFAARFRVPREHGSYQALVEDPEVEAIYIASPHSEHASRAEMALRPPDMGAASLLCCDQAAIVTLATFREKSSEMAFLREAKPMILFIL